MNTEIKYEDGFGNIITQEQQQSLIEYEKITYEMGNIKMIESFHQSRGIDFKIVKYFLAPDENKADILQRYTSALNNVRCIIYFEKQSANKVNLWDYEEYGKDGNLYFKGKQAFDALNRLIFVCLFDLVTNQLQDRAKKYYYGTASENSTNESILNFTYDSTGNVVRIIDIQEKFGYIEGISLDEYLADTEFSQVDFPWDQHTYYHAVTPYLPTGNL